MVEPKSGLMITGPRDASGIETPAERRRTERVDAVRPVHGRLLPADVHVTLVNVSPGGVLVQTPAAVPRHASCECRFEANDAEPIVVHGRVVHAMRITTGDSFSYVVGVEFVDQGSDAHEQAVRRLVTAARPSSHPHSGLA